MFYFQTNSGPTQSWGVSASCVMFKNTFQSGFLSILYSIGSKPLQIWDKKVRRRLLQLFT